MMVRVCTWTGLALLLIGILLSAAGALESAALRCNTDGTHCVPDCADYTPTAEDDACWLIKSCASDYRIPPLMGTMITDYRGDCP